MRTITARERYARLARRHALAPRARAADPLGAARAVVGLHSSDPTSVFLSARARVHRPTIEAVERALYEDRALVRALGMRRTMFVVPHDTFALMHHGCAAPLGPAERRRTIRMIEASGMVKDGARWLRRAENAAIEALADLGQATAKQLTAASPILAKRISYGHGTRWAGEQGLVTRVLFLLSAEGRVLRARPLGSWISGQYRWALTEAWLGEAPPDVPAVDARAELLRRYLAAFGPCTMVDLRWWTGWTLAHVRRALAELDAVAVDLERTTGWILPDDLAPIHEPAPWAAFLPGLDPTVMGWKEREWYLAEHAAALFDRNGNAGPTVWWNGRVVGGWLQRQSGEIAYRLLEDVGAEAEATVEDEAERLQCWLGDTRVIPRFRTPLEIELGS
jgi:hypothetical protein